MSTCDKSDAQAGKLWPRRIDETIFHAQVTKDQFRNPDLFLRVDFDRNSSTVVEDRDHVILFVYGDLEAVHGLVIDLVYGRAQD
jgi:hypothetical protein